MKSLNELLTPDQFLKLYVAVVVLIAVCFIVAVWP